MSCRNLLLYNLPFSLPLAELHVSQFQRVLVIQICQYRWCWFKRTSSLSNSPTGCCIKTTLLEEGSFISWQTSHSKISFGILVEQSASHYMFLHVEKLNDLQLIYPHEKCKRMTEGLKWCKKPAILDTRLSSFRLLTGVWLSDHAKLSPFEMI